MDVRSPVDLRAIWIMAAIAVFAVILIFASRRS
jgi:hypothetical protein